MYNILEKIIKAPFIERKKNKCLLFESYGLNDEEK